MAAQSQQFMTDLKVNMTPDTVQIRTTSTVNNYGERTYSGGATTYDAYIIRVEEARRTRQRNGHQPSRGAGRCLRGVGPGDQDGV